MVEWHSRKMHVQVRFLVAALMFKNWTCIFPGKMGISWKQATWNWSGTKEEAEKHASQYCNCIAVPIELFEHIKKMESRVVSIDTLMPN
jgi:hypothetical protein